MDTTVINSKAKSKASEMTTSTSTSTVAAGSPVWSSGSGAIKEIRLHNAEMKVKSLEKENEKLKEHEEFYINKAREWKGRALKYEKVLEQNSIEIPSKDRRRATVSNTVVDANSSEKSSENIANTPDVPPVDSATAKVYQAAGFSPRTSANPLKDLQNLRAEEAVSGSPPVTPTEDIKLVLSRRSEARKTEDDFRLPEAPRQKRDECKQQ